MDLDACWVGVQVRADFRMSENHIASAQPDLHKLNVLFVDASTRTRELMRALLAGFAVRSVRLAETGEEALGILKRKDVGLIITDWQLAPMDGFAFIRRVRAVANYPKAIIPIMVLSAKVDPKIVETALEAGANHFVTKPVVPAKLLERIHWALADRRPYVIEKGRYVLQRGVASGETEEAVFL